MLKLFFLLYSINIFGLSASLHLKAGHDSNKILIPIGGNSWTNNLTEIISDEGLKGWSKHQTICKTYLRVNKTGKIKISIVINALGGTSSLNVTLAGKGATVSVSGNKEKEFFVGEWFINEIGYIAIEIQGKQKSKNAFGDLSFIAVSGSAINTETAYVKNNNDNYFYWGRRGPSVHLKYNTEGIENIEWFYSEIRVPIGNDVVGTYYMANGFKEGYFGIQVNSEIERRVLFSVWSPFQTDDPTSIPEEQKIKLIKKGKETHIGEFGNEGAGGQSYLQYDWKAGHTYKFLLKGNPTNDNHTIYSAYFYAPEENKWILIASFDRPMTSTYLTNLHSFLENFVPETGNIVRMAYYQNQWVYNARNKWTALDRKSVV